MITPADEFEIRALIASNAELADKRDTDNRADQYAQNALFVLLGNEVRGRENIRASFHSRPPTPGTTRHMVMSPVLRPETADRVAGTTYFQFIKKTDSGWTIAAAGHYEDIFERQPDKKWLFHTRRIVFA